MPRSQNLAEKIISGASGQKFVMPGEIVVAKVDLAMIHDSGGPRRVEPILQRLGAELFDPQKVVLISDHFVPGSDPVAREILGLTRHWAKERRVAFYDSEGICHVVLPERGHLKPGMFVVGGDSHSPTGGAFGAYMFGVGATEMAGVLATGEIWIKVPETILIEWNGALQPGVLAKDIMLALCAELGMGGGRYQAVQYAGTTISALSMQERMTLSNMAAELGAQAGLIEPDGTTADYLNSVGADCVDVKHWRRDTDAKPAEHHVFDAGKLEPQVAAPHSPANSTAVSEADRPDIDVAYIGACTGAKYADLQNAATLLKGQKLAPNVELLIAPSSKRDQERAQEAGLMKIFEDAGAKNSTQRLWDMCRLRHGAPRRGCHLHLFDRPEFQGSHGGGKFECLSGFSLYGCRISDCRPDRRSSRDHGRETAMSSGKAFVFGNDIDTDMLAPGQYMAAPIGVLASHCLESIAPEFAKDVQPGDIIFAGENFGIGSSREQAAQALKHLGIAAVVARSFGGIFYRNAINLGLAVFETPNELPIETGESVSLEMDRAMVTLTDRQENPATRPPARISARYRQERRSGGSVGKNALV